MSLSLAGRMKRYEHTFRTFFARRSYTLLRLDGRAFHVYTRGLERPFNAGFAAEMDATALALCQDISTAAFAFVQSDEISVLLTDFATHDTEPWMGGNIAETLSLSAARATATFNRLRPEADEPGLFDSRGWSMSDPAEVATTSCGASGTRRRTRSRWPPRPLPPRAASKRPAPTGSVGPVDGRSVHTGGRVRMHSRRACSCPRAALGCEASPVRPAP